MHLWKLTIELHLYVEWFNLLQRTLSAKARLWRIPATLVQSHTLEGFHHHYPVLSMAHPGPAEGLETGKSQSQEDLLEGRRSTRQPRAINM